MNGATARPSSKIGCGVVAVNYTPTTDIVSARFHFRNDSPSANRIT